MPPKRWGEGRAWGWRPLYEKKWERIHAVMLDMIMPDMSGGDTFDRLKEINPSVKVILSSGYDTNGRAEDIMNRGCDAFIQKPYNVKELSNKIGRSSDLIIRQLS